VGRSTDSGRRNMGILWIILIVVVVLALFGFIGRGMW
jgi:flagellar basal body-associated protein FliL